MFGGITDPPIGHGQPVEAADERDDVVIAHLLQVARRQHRAHAAGAVDDDRGLAIGHEALDVLLDVGLREVHRATDVALLPLAVLAAVDEGGAADPLAAIRAFKSAFKKSCSFSRLASAAFLASASFLFLS